MSAAVTQWFTEPPVHPGVYESTLHGIPPDHAAHFGCKWDGEAWFWAATCERCFEQKRTWRGLADKPSCDVAATI